MLTRPATNATLLFPWPVTLDAAEVSIDIASLAKSQGLTAHAVPGDNLATWLYDLGPVQIEIGQRRDRLDPVRHMDAARPEVPLLTETVVLSRLTAHRFCLEIRVRRSPGAGVDSADTKKLVDRICWLCTDALGARLTPSLVIWGPSEILYAREEFECATPGAHRACLPLLTSQDPARVDMQREIEARALSYIYGQIDRGAHRVERRDGLLQRLLHAAEVAEGPGQRYVVRGLSVIALVGTVALATVQAGAGTLPGF